MQKQLKYVGEEVEMGITQSEFHGFLDITNLQQSSEKSMYEKLVLRMVSYNGCKTGSDTESLTLKDVQPADLCLVTCDARPEIIP